MKSSPLYGQGGGRGKFLPFYQKFLAVNFVTATKIRTILHLEEKQV